MIKIFNQQMQPIAILENAYNIGYEKRFNELWTASFSMPADDPKNEECHPLNFVEIVDDYTGEYIGLFRIIPSLTRKNESDFSVEYQCEHVLATLLDDVLFQYHQTTNLTTRDTLQYILDFQSVKRWKLGTVAINRYFSYKWENENLLSSAFSVPKPFDVPYQWTWDTTSYPWILNLVAPETEVTCEIRYGKNMIGIEREIDPTEIVNRIYPLGYGEGVNQLTIKDVNNGIPYVEDAESIAKYGLRSYIWVDKRFEDVNTLKANALSLLRQWKEPKVTYRVSAADLSSITKEDIDKLKMGRIVRIVDPDIGIVEARIVKEAKNDIKGNPGDIQLEIANKSDDITTLQSDLERRQQINEVYAQGATNIDSHDYSDNADPDNPAVIRFYIPDEVVRLNKLLLTFETSEFRAYSRAIKGGGAVVTSTSAGGGTTVTSSSGGGSQQTSSSGGGGVYTSESGGGAAVSSEFTNPTFFIFSSTRLPMTGATFDNHFHSVQVNDELNHRHTVNIPSHTHAVNLPNHTHTVNIPNHTHNVSVPDHTHQITLPNHSHEIEYGIFKLSTLPTLVTIKVDGKIVPYTNTSGENIDLVPYVSKESDGTVSRGWHTIEIAPNDLGRITANVVKQVFIQSRGEYTL
jgi:phage minor structural protein